MLLVTPRFPTLLAVVALGGAVGGLARHGVDVALPAGDGFPLGTFLINVVGAALLALLPSIPAVDRRPLLPPLIGTGVLGGFTTLSAFSEQTRALVDAGRTGTAATYVVASLAVALVAVLAVRGLATAAERTLFRTEGGEE